MLSTSLDTDAAGHAGPCRLIITAVCAGAALFSTMASACDPGFDTTGPAYCFVSEIGGCANLPAFLASHQPSYAITVVVDGQCGPYSETLTLPGRITLAGVGRDGAGELQFENLATDQPAIAVAAGHGHVQIRDLLIRNIDPVVSGTGLRLHGNSMVSLNGVRIDRFNLGVLGRGSYSILINQSNISDNNFNLWIDALANSWRVRDSVLSGARGWSVVVQGPNNDVLFDGNRLESNRKGGFRLHSFGAVLSNNRLEYNGYATNWHGIEVQASAEQTRLLNNYFSSDVIADQGVGTRCAFNTNVVEPASCQ
jgi:parallel beta-helix repeat protein